MSYSYPGNAVNRGDSCAIVVVAKDSNTGVMYVLDADITKMLPEAFVETILTYCQLRRFTNIAIEDNGFQELIKRELERRAAQKNIHAPAESCENRSLFKLQGVLI